MDCGTYDTIRYDTYTIRCDRKTILHAESLISRRNQNQKINFVRNCLKRKGPLFYFRYITINERKKSVMHATNNIIYLIESYNTYTFVDKNYISYNYSKALLTRKTLAISFNRRYNNKKCCTC